MYYVQDAHSFWDWIYFVLLIVVNGIYQSIVRLFDISETISDKCVSAYLCCETFVRHFNSLIDSFLFFFSLIVLYQVRSYIMLSIDEMLWNDVAHVCVRVCVSVSDCENVLIFYCMYNNRYNNNR